MIGKAINVVRIRDRVMMMILAGIWIMMFRFRGEPFSLLVASFGVLFWFTCVPGTLLVMLFESGKVKPMECLVLGMGVGTALFPLEYLTITKIFPYANIAWMITVVNLILLAIVLSKTSAWKTKDPQPAFKGNYRFLAMALLAIVSLIVFSREATQLRGKQMQIRSTQEVDSGYLMGLVAGLKNNGLLVDAHNSNAPIQYHYFAYLLMAMVSKFSGASILSLFQLVFPLAYFTFLALAVFFLAGRFRAGPVEAFLASILVLVLDDFSIMNQLLKLPLLKDFSGLFYTSWAIPNIHLSPSQLISIFLAFTVLLLFARLMKSNRIIAWICPFLVMISLPGFKVSTWVCLMAGLGTVAAMRLKKAPAWFWFAMAAGIAGAALSLLLFKGSRAAGNAFSGLHFAYPVLKNAFFQHVIGLSSAKVPISALPLSLLLKALLLVPLWLLLTYGIRILGTWRWLRSKKSREGNEGVIGRIVIAAAVFGIILSIFISQESMGSANTYYFSIFGMFILLPVIVPEILASIQKGHWLVRAVFAGLLSIQMASGVFYIVKPHLKPDVVASLNSDWLSGMKFIRGTVPKDAILLSNRFDVSHSSLYANYNEKFYFIPGFAERTVYVSGAGYNRIMNSEYIKKRKINSEVFSNEWGNLSKEARSQMRDKYIVLDKWMGDRFSGASSTDVKLVYSNAAIDIYKVSGNWSGLK